MPPGRGATLAKPSRHVNTTQSASVSSSNTPRRFVPKLTDNEKKLLSENNGCFKCCIPFTNHCSANCPNDFPDPATYKTLTFHDVEAAKCNRKGKAVAYMANANADSEDNDTPAALPVAMVMGQSVNPVTYMPTNDSNVIEGESDSDSNVSPTVVACIDSIPLRVVPKEGDRAPFQVPHLY